MWYSKVARNCSRRNSILSSSERRISLLSKKNSDNLIKSEFHLQFCYNCRVHGMLSYLPVSILSLWLPILSFTNDFLERVWIFWVWSENGCEKWHFLVWNRVKIWRTKRHIGSISVVSRVRGMSVGSFSRTAAGNRAQRHTPTKNSQENPPGITLLMTKARKRLLRRLGWLKLSH